MQVESYPALFSPCVAVISASSMASSVSYFSMRSNAFCMTVCLLSCLARSEAALLLAILFFKRLIWRAISKPRTILFSLSIGRFSSSCSSPFPSAQVSICFRVCDVHHRACTVLRLSVVVLLVVCLGWPHHYANLHIKVLFL